MNDIILDDQDELEYDLTNIGLKDTILSIEKECTYIASDLVYIEIPKNNIQAITIINPSNYILKYEDDILVLNKEQYEIIFNILQSNFTNN